MDDPSQTLEIMMTITMIKLYTRLINTVCLVLLVIVATKLYTKQQIPVSIEFTLEPEVKDQILQLGGYDTKELVNQLTELNRHVRGIKYQIKTANDTDK